MLVVAREFHPEILCAGIRNLGAQIHGNPAGSRRQNTVLWFGFVFCLLNVSITMHLSLSTEEQSD